MNLREKLKKGRTTIGSWITLGNTGIAEILAKAGFDWLVIDLEHSTISIEQAGELIRTVDLAGVPPLVRVTSNDACQIKRVLDAGAHGVVVPSINCKQDAEKAVAATRYAPVGNRGVGLARAQGYGSKFSEYLDWQENATVVIVQIEHIDALKNLAEIFSTPGVDGFIIGPYDLSCSMGMPGEFERDEFKEVVNTIFNAGVAEGCPAGMHMVEPDPERLERLVQEGYKILAYSVDIRMLDVSARVGAAKIKRLS
jgi:2-dehydro-3-deoxyglucarate aldolase